MKKSTLLKTLVLAYMTFLVFSPLASAASATGSEELTVAWASYEGLEISGAKKGGTVKIEMESDVSVTLLIGIVEEEGATAVDESALIYQSDFAEKSAFY